jgi:hypothetical protein
MNLKRRERPGYPRCKRPGGSIAVAALGFDGCCVIRHRWLRLARRHACRYSADLVALRLRGATSASQSPRMLALRDALAIIEPS